MLESKLMKWQNRQRNQKKRYNLAVVLKYATSEFKSKLKLRNEVGKPRIETVQPYFMRLSSISQCMDLPAKKREEIEFFGAS
jgi:hypothetical protein